MLTLVPRPPRPVRAGVTRPRNRSKASRLTPLARAALLLYGVYRPTGSETREAILRRATPEGYTLSWFREQRYSLSAAESTKLLTRINTIVRLLQSSCHATALATGLKVAQQLVVLGHSVSNLSRILENLCQPANLPITPRTLRDELIGIEREFQSLSLSVPGRYLDIRTAGVVLEGTDLGEFQIRIPFDSMVSGHLEGVRVTGLDASKAAAGRPDYCHPHVGGGRVCWGEGAKPAARALREGRLFDFTLIVWALLNTYNEASPYTPLETWRSRRRSRCRNCEAAIGDTQISRCGSCESDYCRECSESPKPCCNARCGREVCRRCRFSCQQCKKEGCSGCVVNARTASGGGIYRFCPDCNLRCRRCGLRYQRPSSFEGNPDDWNCPNCATILQEAARSEQQRKEQRELAERRAAEQAARTARLAETPENLETINLMRADLGLPPLVPGASAAAIVSAAVPAVAPVPAAVLAAAVTYRCDCHDCRAARNELEGCDCDDCVDD